MGARDDDVPSSAARIIADAVNNAKYFDVEHRILAIKRGISWQTKEVLAISHRANRATRSSTANSLLPML